MKIFWILIICLALYPAFCLAEQIDINTATLAQLDELTGIGPVYAQRIIDGRPYASVDDLDRVKGIGSATLAKIKTQGWACVNCSAATSNPQPVTSNTTNTPENSAPPTAATAPASYPSGVYINEILPNPQGADETDEYIKLYNSNSTDIDLSGWKLQDKAGTITTYTIPSVTKILANGYLVFKRPDTKIMLNNDGDGVNLLTPDGKIVDSVSFVSAPLGQTYKKSGNDWSWPGSPLAPSTKTQKSANNSNITTPKPEDLTANLDQGMSGVNPWPLFVSVLVGAIILGVITLLIKFKLNKNVRS